MCSGEYAIKDAALRLSAIHSDTAAAVAMSEKHKPPIILSPDVEIWKLLFTLALEKLFQPKM